MRRCEAHFETAVNRALCVPVLCAPALAVLAKTTITKTTTAV